MATSLDTDAQLFVVDQSNDGPRRGGTRPISPTTEWHEMSSTIGQPPPYNGDVPLQQVSAPVERDTDGESHDSDLNSRRVLVTVKAFIGVLVFAIVLVCSVLSKVTLVSLTDRLRYHLWNISERASVDEATRKHRSDAAVLYWQLLFVMVLPSCVTFVRTFIFGVFGKTRNSFPWPTFRAAVMVRV